MFSFAMTGWQHTVHVHRNRRTFGLMVLSGRFAWSMLVLMMLYKVSSQHFHLGNRIRHVEGQQGKAFVLSITPRESTCSNRRKDSAERLPTMIASC